MTEQEVPNNNISVPTSQERVSNMLWDGLDMCAKCFRISRGLEFPDTTVQDIKRLPESARLYTQANSLDETFQSIRQVIVMVRPILGEKIGSNHEDCISLNEIMDDIDWFLKHLIEIDLTRTPDDDLIRKIERKHESAITRYYLTPKFFKILNVCETMYSELSSILWRNGILSNKTISSRRPKLNEL